MDACAKFDLIRDQQTNAEMDLAVIEKAIIELGYSVLNAENTAEKLQSSTIELRLFARNAVRSPQFMKLLKHCTTDVRKFR